MATSNQPLHAFVANTFLEGISQSLAGNYIKKADLSTNLVITTTHDNDNKQENNSPQVYHILFISANNDCH